MLPISLGQDPDNPMHMEALSDRNTSHVRCCDGKQEDYTVVL